MKHVPLDWQRKRVRPSLKRSDGLGLGLGTAQTAAERIQASGRAVGDHCCYIGDGIRVFQCVVRSCERSWALACVPILVAFTDNGIKMLGKNLCADQNLKI